MLRAGLHGLCDPAAGLARGLFMEVAPDSGLPRCTAPFKPHYAAVLVESSGWLNVAANVTKSAMAQVRRVDCLVLLAGMFAAFIRNLCIYRLADIHVA